MTSFTVAEETPSVHELVQLYDSVGWSAYTRDPEVLAASVSGSSLVVAARAEREGALVGLARTLSDGHTVAYLQDILVDPVWHGSGVGRQLTDAVLAHHANVRQIVLLTDTESGQRAFYEAVGFTEVRDHEPPLRAFVRLTG
ncbi:GNAT family N-acetyltransferase [Agrococcus casei]|uniref:GNAT family N-acetyltransferase n=1 Tax=Agrococcus casei TaxID=343512 RepID=UPI003F8F5D12